MFLRALPTLHSLGGLFAYRLSTLNPCCDLATHKDGPLEDYLPKGQQKRLF
jgi:hypothetical protein